MTSSNEGNSGTIEVQEAVHLCHTTGTGLSVQVLNL